MPKRPSAAVPLAGGYKFQAPTLAQISLSPSTALTANIAVLITNPLLTTACAGQPALEQVVRQ